MAENRLQGSIYADATWQGKPVKLEVIIAGDAQQVRLLLPTFDIGELLQKVLDYLGIGKLAPGSLGPDSPWSKMLGELEITPTIVLSIANGDDGKSTSVKATFDFVKPFEFGGATKLGPLTISLEPHVKVFSVYVEYDKASGGLDMKAKVFFDLDGSGGQAAGAAIEDGTSDPDKSKAQVVTYPFPVPENKKADKPKFEVKYFGMGQRFGPDVDVNAPDPIRSTMDALEAQLTSSDPEKVLTDLVQKYYHPDRNWFFGAHIIIRGFAFRIIFNDPAVYGLEITATDGKFKGLLFEILYEKLGPHNGVYYGALMMPEAFRNIDVGAVALTIPSIRLWVYTNGDFKVAIGWPLGKSSLVIQAEVFMGGGGFYFAKLRSSDNPGPWRTTAGLLRTVKYFQDNPNELLKIGELIEAGATTTNIGKIVGIMNSGSVPASTQDQITKVLKAAGAYNPVIEFGLAVSLGVGRSINKGVVSAELSVTLQGTFQGVLAWNAQESGKASSISQAPDDFWIAASVGIVGIIQGSVDLKIIKATLSVRLSITASVAFQTDYKTVVDVSAEVKISLGIKIAFFTIHVSFHARVGHTFVLGSGVGEASMAGPKGPLAGFQPPPPLPPAGGEMPVGAMIFAAESEAMPLARHPGPTGLGRDDYHPAPLGAKRFVERAVGGAPPAPEITLKFVLHPTVSYDTGGAGTPAGVAQLFISAPDPKDPKPGSDFETLLSHFEDFLFGNYGHSWTEVLAALKQGNEAGPADFGDKVKSWLEGISIGFEAVDLNAGGDAASVAAFPMLPELTLTSGGTITAFGVYDAAPTAPSIPTDYPEILNLYFEALSLTELSSSGNQTEPVGALNTAPSPISLARNVFNDYFLMIARQMADHMAADEDPTGQTAPSLIDDDLPLVVSVSGMASRYLLHGLRVPDPAKVPTDIPEPPVIDWSSIPVKGLYELTGQQIPVPAGAKTFSATLAFNPNYTPNEGKWSIIGDGVAQMPLPADAVAAPDLHFEKAAEGAAPVDGKTLISPLAPLSPHPLYFTVKTRSLWHTPGGDYSLVGLPEPLAADLTGTSTKVTAATSAPAADGKPVNPISATPALVINFEMSRIRTPSSANAGQGQPTGLYLKNVYQVSGIDEETRELIDRALETPNALADVELTFAFLDGSSLTTPDAKPLLAKVNLSTTSQPGSLRNAFVVQQKALAAGALAAELEGPASAAPDKPTDFLRLLWESAIVNAPGFFLNVDDVPDDAFQSGDTLSAAIVVTFGTPAQPAELLNYHNAVSVTQTEGSIFMEVMDRFRCAPTYPAGCIGFELQNFTVDGDSQPYSATTMEALYNLIQFQIAQGTGSGGAGAPSFDASLWGHAMGPADDSAATAPSQINTYRAIVPVYKFVEDTHAAKAFAAAGPLTTNLSQSRYSAVGGQPGISFTADDTFGNQLPVNGLEVDFPVLYHDALVPSDEWPGIAIGYRVTGSGADAAQLELSAAFNVDDVVGTDKIAIAGPSAGQTVNATTVTVYGTVRDPRDAVTVTADNSVAATVNADGTWAAPGVTLAAGANTITATAKQPTSDSISTSITVTSDPSGEKPVPPALSSDTIASRARVALGRYGTIIDQLADPNTALALFTTLEIGPVSITAPKNGALTAAQTVTVKGLVQDVSSRVTVNGTDAGSIGPDGSFTVPDVALTAGRNVITVTATNDAGPQSREIIVYQGQSKCATRARVLSGKSVQIANSTVLRAPIQTLIAGAKAQLQAIIDGNSGTAPESQTISVALDLTSVKTRLDDIFEIAAFLRLSREAKPDLIDIEAVTKMPSVASIASEIQADLIAARKAAVAAGILKADTSQGAVTLAQFAADFEIACDGFDGATGRLKLASRPQPGSGETETTELWAVKWSATNGIDVSFPNAIGDAGSAGAPGPVYFAPKPLSTKLLSGSVPVTTYAVEGGALVPTTTTQSYSGISLDDWAQSFVLAFTDLMRADVATSAARLSGPDYAAMLGHKASLAESISRAVAPVFEDQIGKGDLSGAQERFEQALLVSLGADYTTSAIVQVPADISVSGVPEIGSSVPPRLFGAIGAPVITVATPVPGAKVPLQFSVAGSVDHTAASVTVTVTPDGGTPVEGTVTMGTGNSFTAKVVMASGGAAKVDIVARSAAGLDVATSTFPVDVDASIQPLDAKAGGGSETGDKGYTLGTTQLPLVPGDSSQRHLEFLVTATDDGLSDKARLALALNYHVENIEHAFDTAEAEFGYTPSSWLKVVRSDPGSVLDFDLGSFDIPLPLREFPDAPLLVSHASAANVTPSDNGVIITRPTSGTVVNTSTIDIHGKFPTGLSGVSVVIKINDNPGLAATVDDTNGTFSLLGVDLPNVGVDQDFIITAVVSDPGGPTTDVGQYTVDITCLAGVPLGDAIDAVLKWNYDVRIGAAPNAHDELWLETVFNPPVKGANQDADAPAGAVARDGAADPAQALFAAMAAFNAGYDSLKPTLAGLKDGTGDTTLLTAAYKQVEVLVDGVATAWQGTLTAEPGPVGGHPETATPGWYMLRFPEPPASSKDPYPPLTVYGYKEGTDETLQPVWPEIDGNAHSGTPKLAGADAPAIPPGAGQGYWWVTTYDFDPRDQKSTGLAEGLSLLDFRWDGLHMLELQSANTSAYIVRNADLGVKLSEKTNPDFIYSTPTVQFATPAVPFADVGVVGPLDPEPTLVESLKPIFEPFAKIKLDVPRLMKVDVRFSYEMIAGSGGSDGLWSELPVLLVSDLELTSDIKELDTFVANLSQSIQTWHATSAFSDSTKPARISLGISVFAQLPDSEVQLVDIAAVEFNALKAWW